MNPATKSHKVTHIARETEINVKRANSNSAIHHHMPFCELGVSIQNETKCNEMAMRM